MPKRLAIVCFLKLVFCLSAVCIGGGTEASAQERCLVADPTGTPLNVRIVPGGDIVETLSNGTLVTILDRSSAGGRTWVYVGRYEDHVPIGWVYGDYLDCTTTATSGPSPYAVDGLALGGQVRFDSKAYKQYECGPSDTFPGFTWCHKQKTEKNRRGEVTSSNSILHSGDGRAVYVNRYIEPAFFGPNDVRSEIERLSARFGERPREFRMPRREGLPDAIIAVWGKIKLERLDAADVSVVAASGKIRQGLLVSFLGGLQRSARAGVPVYRLTGGAGFLWAAMFNRDGRGVLRFLTIDASQIKPPPVAQNPQPPLPESAAPPSPPVSAPPSAYEGETRYAEIGRWSVTHREAGNLSVCSAAAQFADRTILQLALIQSDTGKTWAVLIANPRWNAWVGKGSWHRLLLVTTKPWHEAFDVSDDKKALILGGASVDFMNSLADTDLLRIFTDNEEPLATLDVRDSDPAIKAVVNCVRDHPFNRAPTPEAAETTFSGTAFFIAPNLLLTNDHVVKQCKGPIQVRYPDLAPYPATISGLDETNDLALLHTDMSSLSAASFSSRPRLGEFVAAYGFPYAGVLSSSGNFTVGNVTSLSGMSDDTRFLQISTPIQPGNSGGPLLDMSGNVVGVVVAQLNALAVMQAEKSVPQNVNFAIQVPIVINFLSVKGVSPKLDTSNAAGTLPPSYVADLAKKFTVQVYCEGSSPRTSGSGQEPDGANLTRGHR